MKKINILYSIALIFATLFFSCTASNETGEFVDTRDGRVYEWVKIGSQTWMSQNLSFVPDSGYLDGVSQEAIDKFGCSYNLATAKAVCPEGWHLPNEAEWTILFDCLGGKEVAGGKLKSPFAWGKLNNTSLVLFNLSGFSALPRSEKDIFAFFWVDTPTRCKETSYVLLSYYGKTAEIKKDKKRKKGNNNTNNFMPFRVVRCVKVDNK